MTALRNMQLQVDVQVVSWFLLKRSFTQVIFFLASSSCI